MRQIYSVTFDVAKTPQPSLQDLIGDVAGWMMDPARPDYQRSPKVAHDITTPGFSIDGARSVETLRWPDGWALRWMSPGSAPDKPGIVCDVILRDRPSSINVSVEVAYERGASLGYDIPPRRPRIVPMLINKYRCTAGIGVAAKVGLVNDKHIPEFISDVLNSADRKLPVVLFSPLPDSNKAACNTDLAGDVLAGMAHVNFLQSSDAAYALTELVGKSHSCFNGCARVYWAGWQATDKPHPLVWPEDLVQIEGRSEYRGANRLLRLITPAVIAIRHEMPSSFVEAKLQIALAKKSEESGYSQSEYKELFDLYESELREKSEQIAELSKNLVAAESQLAARDNVPKLKLRVAVCFGSAADPRRKEAWERRFDQLERENGVDIDREYFSLKKLPGNGFDFWLLDEKTVAGHKEHGHSFGKQASGKGAEAIGVRNTTEIAAGLRLTRVS